MFYFFCMFYDMAWLVSNWVQLLLELMGFCMFYDVARLVSNWVLGVNTTLRPLILGHSQFKFNGDLVVWIDLVPIAI